VTSSTPEFQREVARVALRAAGRHGFALAGGQALMAYGLVSRPTADVDLFTADDGAVRAAVAPVTAALTAAGYTVQAVAEPAEMVYGLDDELLEFEVSDGDQVVELQMAHFDRGHQPVTLPIGPVLHLDDLVGTKVAAMATRAEPRDYVDVAAALDRYDRAQLIALAVAADPGLTGEELAESMRRLDRLDDEVFAFYDRTPAEVAELRTRFAGWPRDPGTR
jgi:hypothetical protein